MRARALDMLMSEGERGSKDSELWPVGRRKLENEEREVDIEAGGLEQRVKYP